MNAHVTLKTSLSERCEMWQSGSALDSRVNFLSGRNTLSVQKLKAVKKLK